MKISFNLRLGFTESLDCIAKIRELGGDGCITVGGSRYGGTSEQLDGLLVYMGEKGYDMDILAFDDFPNDVTKRRIDQMKKDGIIKI